MTTVSSNPSFLDLHVGAPKIDYSATETMSILMKTRKVDPNGQVCNTGATVTVPKAFGQLAVEMGWATDVNAVLPNRIGRTVDENRTLVSNFTYDGSNRLTGFYADGLLYSISYPDTTHINIACGANSKQITLNALQQVTGIVNL